MVTTRLAESSEDLLAITSSSAIVFIMQLRECVMMHSFTNLIMQIAFGCLRSRDGALFEAWRNVSAH